MISQKSEQSFCTAVFGQNRYKPPRTLYGHKIVVQPRLQDGKPNLTAPAPRTADGKPDLSGIWGLSCPVANARLRATASYHGSRRRRLGWL
jgi:hypothetical protein